MKSSALAILVAALNARTASGMQVTDTTTSATNRIHSAGRANMKRDPINSAQRMRIAK